jgi:HD-GYP domain-containing protein (c-di-GMP phosphodiesterase class II)
MSYGTATIFDASEDFNKVIKKAELMMQRNKSVISKELQLNIIAALQKLLEAKSEETIDHALRININSIRIGKIIGLTDSELHELALLAALHDVGKIAIPDSIILKKEKLTPEEWEIMKKHSEIGYNLTQSIPELSHISDKILQHHEWWNGEGYPDGLAGEEIPLLSRVIAVTDAYDVMTSGRSYKKSFSHKKALGELKKFSGIHFDPRLVDIFIEIQEQNNHKTVNQPSQSSSGG